MSSFSIDDEPSGDELPFCTRDSLCEKDRISLDSENPGSEIWEDDPLQRQRQAHPILTIRATIIQSLQQHSKLLLRKLQEEDYAIRLSTSFNSTSPFAASRLLSHLRSYSVLLLPSFLHSLFVPAAQRQPLKLHPTSWLDGIRGLAALFVFFYHFSQRIWATNDIAWGGHTDSQVYTGFFRLPIIRILYAGPAAVSVFFVVSGFALSIKPISQMWRQDKTGLLSTVSSATLRRPLRLFLPCFAATFMDFVAVRAGLFEATRWVAQNAAILTGVRPPHIGLRGPFWAQFWDWLWKGLRMIDIFSWGLDRYGLFQDDYDKHLWTIPIEFRCSLILFLTQMALSNLDSIYRISIQTALAVLAHHTGRWDMCLFWGGGVLCELYHAYNIRQQYLQSTTHTCRHVQPKINLSRLQPAIYVFFFLLSLFLVSYPRIEGRITPGYIFLTSLLPTTWNDWSVHHFFQGTGALLLVATVGMSPGLSRMFASAPTRYLGQISFALYLVHGCVNHTMGYWLLGKTYIWFGTGHGENDAVRFGVALLIELVFVVWIADLFYRAVDVNTVRLARWLEERMMVKKD